MGQGLVLRSGGFGLRLRLEFRVEGLPGCTAPACEDFLPRSLIRRLQPGFRFWDEDPG